MSGGQKDMALKESDVTKFLAASTHLGSNNMNFQMEQYIYKRRSDGIHLLRLDKTYEKIRLAARAIAAIENPADVFVISSRPMGQRAVLKFARHVGATPIAGRFTPGAFTNQIQAAFREPRLLVVTDPIQDHQPIREASYVNIPVIALANSDSPLKYVDIAIPCNNKSAQSVGLMWWMLAREVLRLRGTICSKAPWEKEVMPDLFFYRDPEEQEKEETAKAEASKELEVKQETTMQDTWGGAPAEVVEEAVVPAPSAAAPVAGPPSTVTAAADEWGAPAQGDDWGASSATTAWAE